MAINGVPENRGCIERVFRTFSNDFAPRLAGHTFRGIMEKGDADPTARASLNVDDFTFALIRWVVDIYHNTPHRGLGGERPVEAWRRLSKEYGVTPPPDMDMMRMCFGQQHQCRLDKTGITILGVTYQSEVLQNHYRSKNPPHVDVRWHPKDVGEISVFLEGTWSPVPARDAALDGVAAQTWLTALRHTRAANPTINRLDLVAVREAIKAISARNAAAMAAAGLNLEDWTAERIKKAERSLLAGVEFFERAALTQTKDQLGQTIPSVAGLTGTPHDRGRPRKERSGRAKAPQTSFSIEED